MEKPTSHTHPRAELACFHLLAVIEHMGAAVVKPAPVNEIAKLIQPAAMVFQWRADQRLSDVRVTLCRVLNAVPSESREAMAEVTERVFDGALLELLPEEKKGL